MGKTAYTRRQVALGADTSNFTSYPWFVGDFESLTVSITTGTAAASRVTIQGSNDDGFQSTLSSGGGYGNWTIPFGGWSHLTVIIPIGALNLFTVTPGFRWINVIRPEHSSGQTASNMTIVFEGKT